MNDTQTKIEHAAQEALSVVAAAASEATKTIAAAAAAAAAAADKGTSADHDLLIKLETKMDDIRQDIKDLTDGTKQQISDHEQRLKVLEISITRLWTYGSALIFAVGIAQFFIARLWN